MLAGDERIGSRRPVGPTDAELLTGLAGRYVRAVQANADAGVFVGLGRELYRWLDGEQRQLTGLLERAARPVVFEVTGPRVPSEAAWAVLRAPFELLAWPDGGLLAEDALARFCVARRLGPAQPRPGLDGFRLGLAFMASAPRVSASWILRRRRRRSSPRWARAASIWWSRIPVTRSSWPAGWPP